MGGVFVGVPNRGQVATGTATALLQMGAAPVRVVKTHACSLLTLSFNSLWAAALNLSPRPDRFVMLHDDIVPCDPGWLDALLAEHDRCGADVLSVVVPIKDDRGFTSTALMDPATGRMRRVTTAEALAYPRTFGGAEAGSPGWVVLPNTGLWVCRFDPAWVERVCFTTRDRVFRDPSGVWLAQCYSEDWDFGAQLHALGRTCRATTAVRVVHKGGFDYPNFAAFGTAATDPEVNYWNPPERRYAGGIA